MLINLNNYRRKSTFEKNNDKKNQKKQGNLIN